MLDFGKVFNIVFTAITLGAAVFFLVCAITVAAKGKRACGVADIFLRTGASLVFAVSAVLTVCAVLTLLNGDFCIKTDAGVATLYAFSKQTKLPMPQLFEALSATIGCNLVSGLAVCSLAALIVDCLVANKKREGSVAPPVTDGASNSTVRDGSVADQTAPLCAEENVPNEADVRQTPDESVELTETTGAETFVADEVFEESAEVAVEDEVIDGLAEEPKGSLEAEVSTPEKDAESQRAQTGGPEAAEEETEIADEPGSDDGDEENYDVEPNRGIYIPEISTVTRTADAKKPAPRQSSAAGASGRKGGKPSSSAKKPTAKNDKNPRGGEESRNLPVTRRYVILDRQNAVNMFGEYLRNRDGAEKDKLESSINTIIIE